MVHGISLVKKTSALQQKERRRFHPPQPMLQEGTNSHKFPTTNEPFRLLPNKQKSSHGDTLSFMNNTTRSPSVLIGPPSDNSRDLLTTTSFTKALLVFDSQVRVFFTIDIWDTNKGIVGDILLLPFGSM